MEHRTAQSFSCARQHVCTLSTLSFNGARACFVPTRVDPVPTLLRVNVVAARAAEVARGYEPAIKTLADLMAGVVQ